MLYAIHFHFIDGYRNGGPVGGWDESGHSYFPGGIAPGSMVMEGGHPNWAAHVQMRAEMPSAYNGVWGGVESDKSLEEVVDTLRAEFFAKHGPPAKAPEPVASVAESTVEEDEEDEGDDEDDGDEPVVPGPAGRFVYAQSWWIAAQLARSCLLYTSPSPRDRQKSRMPSSA